MKTLRPSIFLVGIAFVLSTFVLASFTITQKPWDVPAKYKSMKNTTKSDATSIANGKTLYVKHCKSCHGTKGYGDGPKAMNLETKIRSFASKEYKAQTMGEKYYKSFDGRNEMPNFEKKVLEDDERWAIVNYIKTLK